MKAVVTGIGALTALGNDAETTWNNVVLGKNGISRITRIDSTSITSDN